MSEVIELVDVEILRLADVKCLSPIQAVRAEARKSLHFLVKIEALLLESEDDE